jgi:hypothetical protein
MARQPDPADDRQDSPGVFIVGDEVIYDGEADKLGLPSKVGQKIPLPEGWDDSRTDDTGDGRA